LPHHQRKKNYVKMRFRLHLNRTDFLGGWLL
jgi:hypothetical protein